MESIYYLNAMANCIMKTLKFLQTRIQESTLFIHIIEKALTKNIMHPRFRKDESNHKCCLQDILPDDQEEYENTKKTVESEVLKDGLGGLCECTPLDVYIQTNYLQAEGTRQLMKEMLVQMF